MGMTPILSLAMTSFPSRNQARRPGEPAGSASRGAGRVAEALWALYPPTAMPRAARGSGMSEAVEEGRERLGDVVRALLLRPVATARQEVRAAQGRHVCAEGVHGGTGARDDGVAVARHEQ